MSDDDGDEDESLPNGLSRRHSHIPEEEEEMAPPHPLIFLQSLLLCLLIYCRIWVLQQLRMGA